MWRRTPNWGWRGDPREGSWRRVPTCSRAHLDGQCDVRIGAEAPAPVTGAVVEASTCGKADTVWSEPGTPLPLHPARIPVLLSQAPGTPGWQNELRTPSHEDSFVIKAIPAQSTNPLRVVLTSHPPHYPSQPPGAQGKKLFLASVGPGHLYVTSHAWKGWWGYGGPFTLGSPTFCRW